MKLYTYWRSLATLRVRIALNLKGLKADPIYVDLLAGHQHQPAYRAVNPQMVVPALVLDDGGPILFQSMAILEYLDETHPTPPLLPNDAISRARVRAISQISVADTHPLVVPRVRAYLENDLKLDEPTRMTWIKHWTTAGMKAIEENLAGNPQTGKFCHGDHVTMADICTVSQAIGYQAFGNDVGQFPTVKRIMDTCMAMDAFAREVPSKQPDAPKQG